ncbi:MAG: SMC-Scp complex subunit ScpB [Planctomycetes bacterium]|nr:SMC-Scp complex subunit ScpB [Planctomycetota bacterium]
MSTTPESSVADAETAAVLVTDAPVETGAGEGADAATQAPSDASAPGETATEAALAAELPPSPAIEAAPEPDGEPGQGELLTDDELLQSVSALIFASPEPLSEKRLLALLDRPRLERVRAAIASVKERLEQCGLPLELRELAGGYQILTTPPMGEVVQRLFKARKAERVSAAALETLAVIAYRQPVSKAEIEAIRGVQAGPILRTLVDRGLVRVTGRADVPGHPLQYGTTKGFLDRFGLGSLEDLPRDTELAKD